jgi:hypothetical protein
MFEPDDGKAAADAAASGRGVNAVIAVNLAPRRDPRLDLC